MSQHVLMDSSSAAPDDQTPPRRDFVEDADSSLTRKRPRLDSGSKDNRAMSTDPAPLPSVDTSAASSSEQPVEMTIRSQPPGSSLPTDGADDAVHTIFVPTVLDHEAPTPLMDSIENGFTLDADQDVDVDQDATADSPPVVAIVDDDVEDAMCDYTESASRYIQVDYDEDEYFGQFPFTNGFHGNYNSALRSITQHFHGSGSLDGTVLPQIALWLDDFPNRPSQWKGYFQNKNTFWDEFAGLVNKVLIRRFDMLSSAGRNQDNDTNRFPFGDQFVNDGQSEDDIFYSFLKSYLEFVPRLLQVDAAMLSKHVEEDAYNYPLVSHRHLRHICTILRQEKAPVFHLLNKDYSADVRKMVRRLTQDFIEAQGVQYLFQFVDAACGKLVPKDQNWVASWITQTLNVLGWGLLDLSHQDSLIDRSEYHRQVLHYFRTYTADLQSPNKVSDVGVTKDLLIYFAELLHSLCQWDEILAAELSQEFMDFRDAESPTTTPQDAETLVRNENLRLDPAHFAALATNAWKFKLLRKYVVKGRMELRVTSIGIMDSALIEIWREYNQTEQQIQHPVMQYLANFLLDEEVVDYIMSVESHPQIISRSGNVVGFLVVTQRYTDRQTDAIWRTVSHSQDPRVVSATINMLKSITGLMNAQEQLYLFIKLYELPIETYTIDIFRFFRDLNTKIQLRYLDWINLDRKSRPWNICIRVVQDTSPSRESTKLTNTLHSEACDQLRSSASLINPEERRDIYRECTTYIACRSNKATGCVRAIWILCTTAGFADVPFFKQNLKIGRHLAEEFCAFVDTESQAQIYGTQTTALQYRLDMLVTLLNRAPEAIPVSSYQDLWDHLVGKFALSNHSRDMAWSNFSDAIKNRFETEFYKKLIMDYVPKLEPEYYTNGLYDFVAGYRFPTTKLLVTTEEGEKEVLQIRGANLLWSMVLNAPLGTIEDRSARLLASRYIEIDTNEGVTLEEVEEAHVALVEQCTKEVLSTYRILRREVIDPPPSSEASNLMDTPRSDSARKQHELRFSRTLLFQKLLLHSIRTKPEFNRSQRSDSKVEVVRPEVSYAGAIEIKYQSVATSEKQSVFIDPENTLQELYMHLCKATRFTRINIFAKGQRLNLLDTGFKKVADLDLAGGLLLVQKAPGSEMMQQSADTGPGCSVFETTVLKHFEELFACMDGDDYISQVKLFDFLFCFPFRDRIAQTVLSGTATPDDTFPPGKVFQAQYAAYALQSKLKEQLRTSALDERFLENAVQLFNKALLNRALISDSLSGRFEITLASVLVIGLLEFLKERPSQETSSRYFSDERALVDRLTTIITVALKSPSDQSTIIASAYATILEASLHSRVVWEAFTRSSNMITLHQNLLLANSKKHLREQIVQTIASVCGGDLPSTSPPTKAETASCFWKIISNILPEAVRYPGQSEQLFNIAEQVFRSHDENSRDEESLRLSLVSWSNLLLSYTHEESVGRDEIDFVVLGFTKLLLSCILSLKSFKKPLNVGSLMEQIFHKFLFIPRLVEVDEQIPRHLELPVLESKTRKELYDLMLALAEDRNSFDMLLGLTESLTEDEEDQGEKSYAVERASEIRSSTGYVGLVNPRCICYMNSLIAQLFMNVNFRKFMLGLNIADAGASQRLLSETQKLLASMQNSYRKVADPRDFVTCVKGLDSAPIDINIQMDADEFYNLLFDQWEGQMLSPEIKQRFRSFYGGQTVNQIKSKECEHVSERVESFFVIQCDVQGKANLTESLQAFVEGDVMEGDNKYKCESCGGKFVDAIKRTCLKDVPDNLIFHLKRFDFDLVDMRRTKINDHFEFPAQLDASLYNVDHLGDPSKPRQEDWFELVGVLVHSGSSDAGHYYSYIRERPSGSNASWVHFNDREVEPFDQSSIPFQCYGGTFDTQFRDAQQKPFSAYMLFYQRRAAIDKDKCEYISSPHCGAPKVAVPSKLEEAIVKDNENFIREYSLYDPYHSKFARQMLVTLRTVNHGTCSEDHRQETQALHIALEHLCQTICRLKTVENFDETLLQLRKTVLSCAKCCHIVLAWLASHSYALVGLLLRCIHAKVRAQVRAFLIDSLRFLREKDPALYSMENVDVDMDTGTVAPVEGILVDITRRLRLVADETGASSRGWDDYYLTLCQLSSMGHVETAVILNKGILEFCLRILVMHAYPPARTTGPDIWRLVEKKKHIFNRLTELVFTLVSMMDINLPPTPSASEDGDRLEKYDRSLSKFPLSFKELYYFTLWHEENRAYAVLDKMIEQFDCTKTEIFYPGEVLKWMLQSPEVQVQEYLLQTVAEGVQALNPPFSDPYVRAALPYCEASPSAQNVEKVIGTVTQSVKNLRDTGGDVHVLFFSGLLTVYNEAVIEAKGVDFFYNQALFRSRQYAVPLLIYDDDGVRKATLRHLEELFTKQKSDDIASDETLTYKYKTVRYLLKDMSAKIIEEQVNDTSRTYMQPMISINHLFYQLLLLLTSSEDPNMTQHQLEGDDRLIQSYEREVETRLRHWPQDEGTPTSTGEPYEQSDYGSESDDGNDLLES
ncbi:hypothetical protein K504DRAFT_446027 [Pleomassaria siparia CBS 279.74]|uniref:USP domain-containing protein n=1 Tax=Pleomassaria siparia CBS 279.74 TaxID=1314801 RepID=A0A6G1KS22_9PLEO|nr:hypothetical protein K504DRAFT_446027 [Pleomassaria siparia CBS 279.74]